MNYQMKAVLLGVCSDNRIRYQLSVQYAIVKTSEAGDRRERSGKGEYLYDVCAVRVDTFCCSTGYSDQKLQVNDELKLPAAGFKPVSFLKPVSFFVGDDT